MATDTTTEKGDGEQMSHEFDVMVKTMALIDKVLAQNPQAQAIVHAADEAPTNSVDASSRLVVEEDDDELLV